MPLIDTTYAHRFAPITITPAGPLHGLSFVAKDNMDVQGLVASNGSPAWERTHVPAAQHAKVILDLLAAGAALVGSARCDEMCFSLNGENPHFGTPPNPAAPGRVPGGSSSGSASATAQGHVDLALGTDTSGSVRIPASYCGLLGIRTTHSAISLDGVAPLASCFDTIGWFSRSADTFEAVTTALLPGSASPQTKRLLIIDNAVDVLDSDLRDAFMQKAKAVAETLGATLSRRRLPVDLSALREHLRCIQAYAISDALGPWIEEHGTGLSPMMASRLRWSQRVSHEELACAERARTEFGTLFGDTVDEDVLCIFPTAPGPAPFLDAPPAEQIEFRNRALSILGMACMLGWPEVSMPLLTTAGLPIGVSIMGRAEADQRIATVAATVLRSMPSVVQVSQPVTL